MAHQGLPFPTAAWTPKGTLLFTAPQPPLRDHKGRPIEIDPAIKGIMSGTPPGIYEASPAGGKPTLLIRNGAAPVPSPDGRWIAFSGWPDSSGSADGRVDPAEQGDGYLCDYLYEIATHKRYALDRRLLQNSDTWIWTPDSKRLLILRCAMAGHEGEGVGFLYALSVGTGPRGVPRGSVLLATLPARDYKSLVHGPVLKQFRPLRFSGDGRTLYLMKDEITGLTSQSWYTRDHSLEAVDLTTGAVAQIATIRGGEGLDWLDPPTKADSGVR